MLRVLRVLLIPLLTSSVLAEPISLFDGKSLTGWDCDPQMWRVENGLITGGSTTEKIRENDFICTQRSFQNFELKLKIRCSGDPNTGLINSGIQIRSRRVPGTAHMIGYQIDCGRGWFGKIYDEFRRNRVIAEPINAETLEKAVDVDGWNEYRIRAEGPRIQVWINGVFATDYTETDPNIALDGQIGPQVHSGGVCLVQVKDVEIEELPATPGAPTWDSLGGIEAARQKFAPAKSAARKAAHNEVQAEPQTAAQQRKQFRLPEGYEIELVAQESPGIGKFVSVYFDQRGRLWTQTALEYPVDANENPAAAEALYQGRGNDKVLVYSREALNGRLPEGGLTNPTVFADGLAIPLGILPWGDGRTCYIQHGHDLKLYQDTDGDGRADTHQVILTGFGVQDSHLFPHQFTRAPGGWIWMAQGLFNNSQVRQPNSDRVVDWPKCGMARMRPDGSQFEVTSTGPNNIWGLVITGDGETFIQEANDYGYPAMPFHEYAYYPGGMAALKKSYQPHFPPQATFRMGGTGLSGLALIEAGSLHAPQAAHTLAVANPIISKVQTIALHRDEAWWKLEQLADLLTCNDPLFRPVALTNGPDGCLYIVDWYNKIISHNEVPRTHPDRDKTRGRIWRIKLRGTKPTTPDFTQLSSEALADLLFSGPIGAQHLAWQTLSDRGIGPKELPRLKSHWAFQTTPRTVRDQIAALGRSLPEDPSAIKKLLAFARPSLPGPVGPSARGGQPIPIREAYDREFERFLVRMFLERHPHLVARFLDSEAATRLPVEARVLAALALEPKQSASRVAQRLPQLDRAPNSEELLRLAQFPAEPGVGTALNTLLNPEKSRTAVVETLLAQRTQLDAAQLAPLLTPAARTLLQSTTPAARQQALALIGGFQLAELESDLVAQLPTSAADIRTAILNTLRDLRSGDPALLAKLAKSDPDPAARDAALAALAASRVADASARLLALCPELQPAPRRRALYELSSSLAGAQAMIAALLDQRLQQSDFDPPIVERLAVVLADDPALTKLQQQLGGHFREVWHLDGSNDAWVDSNITLEGPFTVECWVKLAPDIHNNDGILGSPGQIDMNFYQGRFRVWVQGLHDVAVSTKPMTPDLWTHLAVTRDAKGIVRLYQNGELDATGSKKTLSAFRQCRIGWTQPSRAGTQGYLSEFRVWNHARSAEEIRASFDRVLPDRISYPVAKFHKGARVLRTIDTPPLLTEEQAQALDAKFIKYTALAAQGNPQTGQTLSALCLACHTIAGRGGQIGPDLSGAGAMGLQAVLRNLLTPNAAMEPGYRTFRIELKDGTLVDGFLVREDHQAVILRQPGLPDRRIAKADIHQRQFLRRSLMPEGLLEALTAPQAADLLAYLMTLK